jgi:diguanylate cyclase (GGDEF)-like protein
LPSMTASLGLACFPEHGTRSEDLLRAADKALYCAKARGRDCVVIYQPAETGPTGSDSELSAIPT